MSAIYIVIVLGGGILLGDYAGAKMRYLIKGQQPMTKVLIFVAFGLLIWCCSYAWATQWAIWLLDVKV